MAKPKTKAPAKSMAKLLAAYNSEQRKRLDDFFEKLVTK